MTSENAGLWKARKVVIVGAGAVGSTFAYALALDGVADEIVLIDKNRDLVEGQVLDLSHGLPFFPQVTIRGGEDSDYADAQVIVITAGAKQQPGESRLDLLQRNARLMEGFADAIVAHNSSAAVVVVSNPVDVLTYVVLKRSRWPRERIIGSGTVLDSARLRYLLSHECGIDAHNVHAYMLGEHGDSEFAAWSLTHVAGMPIEEYCSRGMHFEDWETARTRIEETVRNSAYHIIGYKGATYFAVALALVRIVRGILRNQRSVLTVSTLLEGEYGLRDVCLSVPVILGGRGVERVVEGTLSPAEQQALARSASILRTALNELRR